MPRPALLILPFLLACAHSAEPESVTRARGLLQRQQPDEGDVVLSCDPADANVAVDGVPQGTCADYAGAPRGLSLGSDVHQIRVEKPGFYPYVTYYEPSDARGRISVVLRPRAAKEGAP